MAETAQANLLRAALAYAARGWHVFPCHTPLQNGCSCRKTNCSDIGKHPRTLHGVKDASAATKTIEQWWRQFPRANIGIATGAVSGFISLDEDTYKGGDTSRIELEHSYQPLPRTVQQLTGGGGVQYLFRHPGSHVKNGVECLGVGLDVRGDGGYIIAPPSLHVSGRRYIWEVAHEPDDIPLADMPDWLYALCQQRQQAPLDAGESITSGKRNDTLFRHGCSLRARGYSGEIILAALQAMNATQCMPPLTQEEVAKIASSCATYIPGHAQNGVHKPKEQSEPPQVHQVLRQAAEPWREHLLTKKNGDPTCNVGNIGLILANHSEWAGRLWWDAVRGLAMLDNDPFTDEMITSLAHWLHVHERLAMSTTKPLKECLMVECHKYPRDLLQTWLNSLPPWDGTPRLTTWLCDTAGIVNDAYGQAISRLLPLSMVARAMAPGCLYRNVIILEGPENTGKSSLVHTLAGEGWYVDLSMALENKESHMMIQGAWLAEMPELDSLSRTEETRLKAFITLKEDSWIPKYSNYRVTVPRRTIFVGTTNEQNYLKGQTGNTRFLPIQTTVIDTDLLVTIREQLFAEALHAYREAGAAWWQLSDEALAEATTQREQRRIHSIYEADLEDWLERRRFEDYYGEGPAVYSPVRNEVTWAHIAQWYLKIDREKWKDMLLQKQIAAALRALGWEQRPLWRDGKTQRLWCKGLDAFDV